MLISVILYSYFVMSREAVLVKGTKSIFTAVLALAREVRARINVVFKMTAVTTTSETHTVNI